MFKYIDTKLLTPKLCLEAVRSNADNFRYIPTNLQTEEICIAAVSHDFYAADNLKRITNRTPKICWTAVQYNGKSIKYVPPKLRTYSLKLAAVKNGNALQYIAKEDQTIELIIIAYAHNQESKIDANLDIVQEYLAKLNANSVDTLDK